MGGDQRLGHQPPSEGAEPVAVVGIGCRFPGDASTPERFWDLMIEGTNTTRDIPEDRWDWYRDLGPDTAAVLRRVVRRGSFLSDVEGFDAEFFGLSPREAELMDPQQRILLEVAWESLEHAGISPTGLTGRDVGVFVGVCTGDYGRRQLEDLAGIEAWTGIGAATCAIANRISYALDLRGPSVSLDTACSASLVAVHLACQSLRSGESTTALAGGVNLVVSPGETITLGEAGTLAPDGRSKSFDASADGYGRGEGCGVLVLKLLADAERDGDRVLAVVRGSAVNQDGRTNGIMAPSQEAQTYVMTRACESAGIAPSSVGYVEAHGTGTELGDPLEAGAVAAVYGAGREEGRPCLIGSVKSNIGHLEGAAGVAGVIKAVLALAHARIPANPLLTEPNPKVAWEESGVRVVTETTDWPAGDTPRRAAVSSFGYGGTVAHVVLEAAPGSGREPDEPRGEEPGGQPRLFPLSAASPAALASHAGRLADWFATSSVPLGAAGRTLALHRAHLGHRAAVVASGRVQLAERLRLLASGETADGVATGQPLADRGTGLVWVFSGHGSQWAGMGRELLAEPAFAAVIDALEPVFSDEIGFSPRRELLEGDHRNVDRAQSMIFAVQVGLAAVWRSYGVTPDAVIGHSVGEIAAAVACGALSLENGGRLICRRSRLLTRVAGKGAMAMVGLPFDEAAGRLAGRDDVVPAIFSSPVSTVLSGSPEAVEALIEEWGADGATIRRVASDVAFHSPQMNPLADDLAKAAADLPVTTPDIPMYRTAVPDPRSGVALDASYWAANLREPVRLSPAVSAAAEDGYRAFLEISAHPVVAYSVSETLSEAGVTDVFVGSSLRRDRPERETLLRNAGELHAAGFALGWERLQPHGGFADLPAMTWQHRRHWRDRPAARTPGGVEHDPESHALLGAPTTVAGSPLRLWRTWLDDSNRPYPGSHALSGVEIVPAAVLVNSFLTAAPAGDGPPVLTDLAMRQPLMTAQRREVQVVVDEAVTRLASRSAESGGGREPVWLTHATARVAGPAAPLPATLTPAPPGMLQVAPGLVHRRLAEVGVPDTGFTWTVEYLLRGPGVLRGTVRMAHGQDRPATWAPLLDAVTSLAPSAYPGDPVLRMVVEAEEIALTGEPPAMAIIDIAVRKDDGDAADTVDVVIADVQRRVLGRVAGLRYAVIGQEQAGTDPRRLVHETVWRPYEPPATPAAHDRPVVVLGGDSGLAEELGRRLGASVRTTVDESAAGADVLFLATPAETADWTSCARPGAELARTALALPEDARLWCVTIGAAAGDLAQTPLWAVGRAIAGEHGDRWGGIVDLDPDDPAAGAEALLAVLAAAPEDETIALRADGATVARLSRAPAEPRRPLGGCRADGTYLVTGGLGRYGLAAAGWLAGRGARRVLLADRRALPPRRTWDSLTDDEDRRCVEAVRGLEAQGVTVHALTVDVADPEQAARLADTDALGLPRVRGVVHAAAEVPGLDVAGLSEERLTTALRTAAGGAWTLHELFPPDTVDFLVLFSSCATPASGPGRAGEAAAAAFLDALAARRGDDGHTVSVGWTPDIGAAEAPEAWQVAVGHGSGGYAVLHSVADEASALFSEMAEQDAADMAEAAGDGPESLAGLSPEELREYLVTEVAAQISAEMKLPLADLDPHRSLVEQGLDSVMTMMVRRRLEKRFGESLPATLLWQRPTVAAIAEHLAELVGREAEPENADEPEAPPVPVGV